MEVVFWQNMVSIHQRDFLETLAGVDGNAVTLVVQETINAQRQRMGWSVPEMKGVDIVVAPDAATVEALITSKPECVHVFSGFNVGAINTHAMQVAIKARRRIGIMLEPYNIDGLKGAMRKALLQWNGIKYNKHIGFILAIGREGYQQFSQSGFAKEKVFPWGYFIDVPELLAKEDVGGVPLKIMYAGRIEPGKGIFEFAKELVQKEVACTLDLYGEGPDKEKIAALYAAAGKEEQVKFWPFMAYADLLQQYARYDWLVLPSSAKDGWGAVVSEGLLNGLKVICSKRAGASIVIKENWNGLSFDWNVAGDCSKQIETMLVGKGFAKSEDIKKWARKSLTGKAGAQYFMAICNNRYNGDAKPAPCWE